MHRVSSCSPVNYNKVLSSPCSRTGTPVKLTNSPIENSSGPGNDADNASHVQWSSKKGGVVVNQKVLEEILKNAVDAKAQL